MVTSPTTRRARGDRPGSLRRCLRAGTALLLAGCLLAGLAPSVRAEDLNDAQDQVRKALVKAKAEIASDKAALAEAADKLAASRTELARARSALVAVKRKLKAARDADAQVAADLAAAEAAQKAAAAAAHRAAAAVAEQEALIGVVVRSAYQQQSTLVGWTMILGSEGPDDLAQRMQWSTTLFDNSTAELDRLTALQEARRRTEVAKASAEAELTAKRRASAAHLDQIRDLTADADARAAGVAELVAANAKLKAEAEDELEGNQEQYQALQAQEKRIAARIRAAERRYRIVNTGGFIRPTDAPAGSAFGLRLHPILHYWRMHWGTDFGAACGAPLRAMADGRVISAGWTTVGFGNYTIISYGKVRGAYVSSGYAHQSKVLVKPGQKVKQGQVVGYVGTTGLSTGCHLHLQIYRDGVRVNPMNYL